MSSVVDRCIVKWVLYTHRIMMSYLYLVMLSSQHLICSRSLASSLIKQVILLLCLIPPAVAASNGIETVTLQLKWHHQFQFAGYYAALEKGFYREAGFDVKLQTHGPDLKSPVDQVISGAAQYGIMDSGLVKDRLNGKPVVALAVIFQKSPLTWLVRQDSDIHSPHDLVGKRAMYLPGLQSSDLLAMLQVEGIPASKINLTPSSFDIQDLIDGHTDAFNAYSTNEPYILREQGIPYRLISPHNYGIDFYGDVLFTSESEIDEHPERVKAFRLASLKGWKYAMDHPDEIIALISARYASNKSLSHLEFEAEAMRELIMPDLVTIGHINPGRWRVIAERLVTLGFAEANYNLLEGFIYDPSPKPQDLRKLYVVIASVALLALLFLGLAIWIWRLNIRFKKSEAKLHESKATLKAQYKAIPIPTYTWQKIGKDMVLVSYNDAAEEITRGGVAGFVGKKASEMYRHMPEIRDEISRCLAEKTIINRDMPYVIQSTGENKYLAVKYAFVPPDLVMVHTEDITERRQAEEGLRRSQKMDALGKLIGGIAHDYNNMLGVVLGYADLLQEALREQPKLEKYAHEIHRAGKRGAKLTKKLLAFSRHKSNEAEVLNLNTFLQDEKHLLEKTLTARIKLVLNLAENVWSVCLDSGDLEDAILNMNINAMHAIDGNGQLTIQTSNEQINIANAKLLNLEPGDYVLLSISDTGSGMDETTEERIFDPFYSTKGEEGTGLGLSQVYGFAQRSGGAIKVYSELGYGTQFVFYFPRYNETSHKQQSIKENNVVEIKGTETILLVDDEPALLNLIREILSPHGFNVISAESVKEALNILQHESIDILISDIIMPEMDGYQLAAIVKEKYPGIKIQLASGFTDDRGKGMVDESLQQNLLLKPFNSQALLQRIRELLNEK